MAPKKGYIRVSIEIMMFARSRLEWIGAREDDQVGGEIGIQEAVLTA